MSYRIVTSRARACVMTTCRLIDAAWPCSGKHRCDGIYGVRLCCPVDPQQQRRAAGLLQLERAARRGQRISIDSCRRRVKAADRSATGVKGQQRAASIPWSWRIDAYCVILAYSMWVLVVATNCYTRGYLLTCSPHLVLHIAMDM